jgi:ABC-type branched-subunit amino acid transport system substrate-binding protein
MCQVPRRAGPTAVERYSISGIRLCLVLLLASTLLAGCAFPGSVKPTVKIGLSAPFEGRYRDLGYEVLYAVRLAVRQRNQAGGIDGRYLVELVALNDFDEPDEAVLQAQKMDVDPGVLGVLGGWSEATALVAGPEYARLGLPFLSPQVDYTLPQPPVAAAPAFEPAFKELSGGAAPGPAAIWAYDAANRLLDALDLAARTEGQPARTAVQRALSR